MRSSALCSLPAGADSRPRWSSETMVPDPLLDLRLTDQYPKTRRGASWYHFAFTFDKDNCLIVRDLDSSVGTRVIITLRTANEGVESTGALVGPAWYRERRQLSRS
ncbi:hypothetical protein GJ744_006284 [Endocarpon pusillum]|uniref:Uncharacterized protein n=1 Tax=Endocarpon pusillum TaxID=364733 RepID=A0A8H7A6W7_9EURO|nr:hypothetical protein GJ744_006284 [Endocarpon pusillum]